MNSSTAKLNPKKRRILQIIIIAAIILIPSLYTSIFLGSMWDPYGNVSNLPVAVVNLDEEAIFGDKTLSIGNELVEKLKESDALNFNFVNEGEAQEGLDRGKYYMIITIPSDFSKSAATVTDDVPHKMELNYKINPGRNYIASKMCQTAVVKLKDELENSIVQSYTESVYGKFSDIGAELSEASDGAKKLDDGALELKDGNNKISDNLRTLSDSTLTFTNSVSEYKVKLSEYLSATDILKEGSRSLNDGMNQLYSKTNQMSTAVNNLYSGSVELNNGLTSLSKELGKKVNNTNKSQIDYLVSSIDSLKNGIDSLNVLCKNENLDVKTRQSIGKIVATSNVLLPKTRVLVTEMYGGLETIDTAVNGKILPGTNKLSLGLKTLNNSVPELSSGVGTIHTGSNKLYNGIVSLTDNNSKLSEGINRIYNGAGSINSGSEKLYNGSLELGDGLVTLKNGCNTLYSSLDDGARTISEVKLSDVTKEMFASPIETQEYNNSYVENNGNAMSAYMMCVGLWVGCLALCIMFQAETDIEKSRVNPKKYFLVKMLKLAGFAVIQASLMIAVLICVNGLAPLNVAKTFTVAIVTSITFMSIVYCLNLFLGKLGSYLLLVFMVLQLSGSAGTYPLELSGQFFNKIHNFMPFTYAVDAFRNAISTGITVIPQLSVLTLISIVFIVLTGFIAHYKIKSKKVSFAKRLDGIMD